MKIPRVGALPLWAQVTLFVVSTLGAVALEYLRTEAEKGNASNQPSVNGKAKAIKQRSTRKNRTGKLFD